MGFYRGSGVATEGLILALDASTNRSYPGSGTTWFDISGNQNNFTLFNSPTYSNGLFVFDGVNDYASSTNSLNLSITSVVTVEVLFRVPSNTTGVMVFEHTPNWNTNPGALGAYTNSQGGSPSPPTTTNYIHTNSASSRIDFLFSNLTNFTHAAFVYRGGTTTKAYNNASLITTVNAPSTPNVVSGYANTTFYIGSRGGTTSFGAMTLAFLRIYNRELSTQEITQNFNATRGRFGI
jgi:hypothetical protein